jgi:hypothetical protein
MWTVNVLLSFHRRGYGDPGKWELPGHLFSDTSHVCDGRMPASALCRPLLRRYLSGLKVQPEY